MAFTDEEEEKLRALLNPPTPPTPTKKDEEEEDEQTPNPDEMTVKKADYDALCARVEAQARILAQHGIGEDDEAKKQKAKEEEEKQKKNVSQWLQTL